MPNIGNAVDPFRIRRWYELKELSVLPMTLRSNHDICVPE